MYDSGIGIGFRRTLCYGKDVLCGTLHLRFVSYRNWLLLGIFESGMVFGGIVFVDKDAPTTTRTAILDIRRIVGYPYNVTAFTGDMTLHLTEKQQKC
jgi:hypothetical protein